MFQKRPTVLAHDSRYHADDIFAVATLELFLGKVKVIRSRGHEKIAAADYVVDVGGIYDPALRRFDHHQTGGAGVRENGIPYAAFGLVWKEFGTKLCGGSQAVADRIDKRLVMPLDAQDNGKNIYVLTEAAVEPYGIHQMFQATLPTWKEGEWKEKDLLKRFLSNVEIAKKILSDEIVRARDKEDADSLVEECFAKSPDKRLLMLDKSYPWSDVAESHPEILFVIAPKGESDWRIQAVLRQKGSFGNRKDLPQSWGGKYDAELEAVTGVKGARFCHRALFMAAANSKEAVLKLAEIALNS